MNWTGLLETVSEVLNTSLFTIRDTPVTVSTLLTVFIIVLVTVRGSRWLKRTVTRTLVRRGGDEGTVNALTSLLHYAVLIVGWSVALQTAGINLTALFAAGAVFAVGIGFAMQNIVQNFVSGVILLVERTIKPGDVIMVEGRIVKILRMGIRATIVQTPDHEEIILPNTLLVQSAVTNYTLEARESRLRFGVGVSYDSDLELVVEALHEAAAKMESTVKGPDHPAEVVLTEFGDNAVLFEVALWVRDPWRQKRIRSEIATRIWAAFKSRNIVIAYPQLDVHFDAPVTAAWESGARSAA